MSEVSKERSKIVDELDVDWLDSPSLFLEPAPIVAPTLLGLVIAHADVAIRVTEVEAYDGARDPGSHAFRRRTERNDALFGPPGTVYAYVNYGIHRALNLVCGDDGWASGCLIRSGEILAGEPVARMRRQNTQLKPLAEHQLARGPGNLASALAIELPLGGSQVYGPDALVRVGRLRQEQPTTQWLSGPRVGVSGPGGDGDAFPWRFWVPGERSVSAYKKAPAPGSRKRQPSKSPSD